MVININDRANPPKNLINDGNCKESIQQRRITINNTEIC